MKPRSIAEHAAEVRAGRLSAFEHVSAILDEAERANPDYHFFVRFNREEALSAARAVDDAVRANKPVGPLAGLPVSVKDAICVQGVESRGGSAILHGYVPPFDATAVAKLRGAGAVIIGKTSQDEFGFGTFGLNTGKGFLPPKNPVDPERVCGGSSSGCGGFTAFTRFSHASLAESTGGSISAPAAFCGVAGLTPTYGRVSRYGLIDYASSLDKIGSMGKTVADAAQLLAAVSGGDEKDSTSMPNAVDFPAAVNPEGLRVGLVKDFLGDGVDAEVVRATAKAVSVFERSGARVQEVSLAKNRRFGVAAYYVIAMAEASTNLAKFCGLRYGSSRPLSGSANAFFSAVRSESLGDEAKRRVLLGTFVRMAGYRDALYVRALRARQVLLREFDETFSGVDVLLHPAMPIAAPRASDAQKLSPAQSYALDVCTVPANLAGLPHASVPFLDSKLPIGIGLTARAFDERTLIGAASLLEGW